MTSCIAGACEPPLFVSGQAASVVVGQPNFDSNTAGTSATAMDLPRGAAVYSGRLFIADAANNRVLIYNTIPTTNGAAADVVFGQGDFASNTAAVGAGALNFPAAVFLSETGAFFVADEVNARVVLRSAAPTTNGASADLAIGAPNLSSVSTTCNQGTLVGTRGGFVAGGRVIVPDRAGHRVLIWNAIPTTDGAPADLVLGQAGFGTCMANRGAGPTANTLDSPEGVWSDGTRLLVADGGNNRILVWTSFPTTTGESADFVIGQPDFTTGSADTDEFGFNWPWSVHSNGTQVFVGDDGNRRVLIWNAFPAANYAPADVVLGQDMFTGNASGTSPTRLMSTRAVFIDGSRLFVADTANHRVLIFDGQTM